MRYSKLNLYGTATTTVTQCDSYDCKTCECQCYKITATGQATPYLPDMPVEGKKKGNPWLKQIYKSIQDKHSRRR